MSRKILRSIKRRQIQDKNSQQPRRKLQFKRKSLDSEVEEGEITSCSYVAKTPDNNAAASDGNDDDCIYIEPKIEQIIIDDEENSLISEKVTMEPSIVTSTPFVKLKDDLSVYEVNDNEHPVFFTDTSRTPWFELNKSDADYVKLSTLHERSETKRRSTRIRNKNSFNSSDNIIVLDDSSICDMTLQNRVKKRKFEADTKALDESVVFISETHPNAQQYIPLESANVPNPLKITPNLPRSSKKFSHNDLFTSSEKKEMNAYNINAYNPNANVKPLTKKRMVLIDGSNVAFKHSLEMEFSVKGLKICIEYFDKMEHEVKAVVPQFRLHRSSDPEEMNRLHKAGKIVFTPCKFVNGKSSSSYDDRFVLQLACELDAAIVSNDNYRDLVNENSAFKKIIENRVMSFTWCNDIFILAKDPYGKWGPPLNSILYRT